MRTTKTQTKSQQVPAPGNLKPEVLPPAEAPADTFARLIKDTAIPDASWSEERLLAAFDLHLGFGAFLHRLTCLEAWKIGKVLALLRKRYRGARKWTQFLADKAITFN